jgi:DNA-binding transcriptional LysR family regulator
MLIGTAFARSAGNRMLNMIHDSNREMGQAAWVDPGILDSKRLQMFYASVKEGSFAAASQLLCVSPSAISHAMKSLEEELGCALFRRMGPQVKPTGAAVRLMPMVEDLLARMASMKNALGSFGSRSESLVFRIPSSLVGLLPPGMFATFSECFPAARLEILVERKEAEDPETDFEIAYSDQVPAEQIRRDLMREELRMYVAPFHGLGQQSKITRAEITQSLLIFPDRMAHALALRHLDDGTGLRSWILPCVTATREVALQGQGIAFLPHWAVGSAVKEGSLVNLKLPGMQLERTCCAWWEPTRPPTWVAQVFLSLLVAEIEAF